jgi:hypothetical protein
MDDMLVSRVFIFSKNKNLFIPRLISKPNPSFRVFKSERKSL